MGRFSATSCFLISTTVGIVDGGGAEGVLGFWERAGGKCGLWVAFRRLLFYNIIKASAPSAASARKIVLCQ